MDYLHSFKQFNEAIRLSEEFEFMLQDKYNIKKAEAALKKAKIPYETESLSVWNWFIFKSQKDLEKAIKTVEKVIDTSLEDEWDDDVDEAVEEAISPMSAQDKKALSYEMQSQDPKQIKDLQAAIGKDFSDNYSSTGYSTLVDVKKKGGIFVAITKEAESKYGNKTPKKGEKEASIGITWNAMFS